MNGGDQLHWSWCHHCCKWPRLILHLGLYLINSHIFFIILRQKFIVSCCTLLWFFLCYPAVEIPPSKGILSYCDKIILCLWFAEYSSVWQPKTASPCLYSPDNIGPDGSAIFYKTSAVKLISQHAVSIPHYIREFRASNMYRLCCNFMLNLWDFDVCFVDCL